MPIPVPNRRPTRRPNDSRNNMNYGQVEDDEPAPIVPTSNMRPSSDRTRTAPNPANMTVGTPNRGNSMSGAPPPMQQQESATGAVDTITSQEVENNQDTDYLANQAMLDLLRQGPRDTSADEKLLQDQMMRAVGQGQADLNARMAASGFGTSGAAGQLGADLRSQVASKGTQQVLDLRQQARDEYLNRVGLGLNSEFRDRGMDQNEEQFKMYMDALLAALGGDTAPAPVTESGNLAENTHGGPDDFLGNNPFNETNNSPLHSQGGSEYNDWPVAGGVEETADPNWVRTPQHDQEGVEAYADLASGVIRFVGA